MIIYRKILKKEKGTLQLLIKQVLENLDRKEFFIPFTEKELEEMFDENKIIIYGAYDDNKLVGTAQLFIEQSYVEDIKESINIKSNKVAELGGYLVLEEYRNKGIMKKLQAILINEARKIEYEYIVITVHPDNVPSNKTVDSVGGKLIKTDNLGGYLRNIYLLDFS